MRISFSLLGLAFLALLIPSTQGTSEPVLPVMTTTCYGDFEVWETECSPPEEELEDGNLRDCNVAEPAPALRKIEVSFRRIVIFCCQISGNELITESGESSAFLTMVTIGFLAGFRKAHQKLNLTAGVNNLTRKYGYLAASKS